MSIPQKIKLKKDTYIKEGEELIGWGSYGEVWKMKRVSDKKIVAVKTIQKKNRYNNDRYTTYMIKEAQKTLDKEIEFLCQLTNSEEYYILPVLDHGKYEGNSFMVMPLADNCLADFIADIDDLAKKEIHLTPERLFKWIIQIATGLQYIHNSIDIDGKPYVHRDFKPKNVLLKDDNAFLCDFGSIKAKKNNDLTGSHIFTISYAAPESLIPKEFKNGKPRYLYGSSADIYSLGISLYCLITQKSSLNCQEELSKYTGNTPNNPHPTLVKHFETIGALSPEEHLLLQEKCHRLFGVKKFEDTTYCPYPALMLPNKKDIVDRIVNLISQMLSPFAIQRPDTKEIIHIAKELKTYYSPKLISLSITAPETIETGDPIDVRINAKGKGLISDGSWLHITLQSSKKTIIFDQFIKEQNDQWRAVFSQKYEPGIYSLNVIACINDREVLEQSKIEVLPEVELTSLSIKSKEYRESGKPIEAYIKITGKFSKKDISSWLFVIIHNSDIQIRANSIVWVKDTLWKATFDPKIPPGLYTIIVKPLSNKYEKYIGSTEITVLDDPLHCWKRKKYVKALVQNSKYNKKWLKRIYVESKKKEHFRKEWLSVLETVRKHDKKIPDINELYWKIKKVDSSYKSKKWHKYTYIASCCALFLLISLGLLYTKIYLYSPKKFNLNIQTIPKNVSLWIETTGQEYHEGLKLSPGHYNVFARKKGYHSKKINIAIANHDEKKTIRLDPILYKLGIETVPEKANIQIKNFEKDYYNGIQLTPGKYEIVVNKNGYYTQTKKIEIDNHDVNETILLKKNLHHFTIKKKPIDAIVKIAKYEEKDYYDGIQLPSAVYQVVVSKNGYHSKTKYVALKDTDVVQDIFLNKISYRLHIETIPENAEIKIRNYAKKYYKGIKLFPGKYEIVVSKDGYNKRKDIVEITDGDYYKTIKLDKKIYKTTNFTNTNETKYYYNFKLLSFNYKKTTQEYIIVAHSIHPSTNRFNFDLDNVHVSFEDKSNKTSNLIAREDLTIINIGDMITYSSTYKYTYFRFNLLIDNSGFIDNQSMENIEFNLSQFINTFSMVSFESQIIKFSSKIQSKSGFIKDKKILIDHINYNYQRQYEVSLYDSIAMAIKEIQTNKDDSIHFSFIVVLTKGYDNSSQKFQDDNFFETFVKAECIKHNIALFVIDASDNEKQTLLKRISENNGFYIHVNSFSSKQELKKAIDKLVDIFKNTYVFKIPAVGPRFENLKTINLVRKNRKFGKIETIQDFNFGINLFYWD